jgi:hypothetical protein
MRYNLEDLFQSINDIFYQFDEGKLSAADAEILAEKCCQAFIRDKVEDKFNKMHLSLNMAFSRGILDGEQLKELLSIYKGEG